MLWRINDTAVYFAATVHIVDEAGVVLPTPLKSSYRDAEHVVFECDFSDPASQSIGMLTDGSMFEDHEPELAREAFDALADLGQDPEDFRQAKPWKVGLALAIGHCLRNGMSLDLGIDRQYLLQAERDKKCIGYLERPIDGLSCFEYGPVEKVRKMLRMAVRDPELVADEMRRILQAWEIGNLTMLARYAEDREAELPGVYGCLLSGRNRRWLDRFVEFAADPRKCLIFVGALHCVGSRGIPELLEESEVSVSRVA